VIMKEIRKSLERIPALVRLHGVQPIFVQLWQDWSVQTVRGRLLQHEFAPRSKVWTLGMDLAPMGKLLSLWECPPLRSSPGVNIIYSLEEWRSKRSVFTPRVQLRS
jgi:hypothetical protein